MQTIEVTFKKSKYRNQIKIACIYRFDGVLEENQIGHKSGKTDSLYFSNLLILKNIL